MNASDIPLWTLDSLVPFCVHGEESVRAWAVTRIGHLRDLTSAPALTRALDDVSPRVVTLAVRSLATLNDVAAIESVRDALRRVMRNRDLPSVTADAARDLLVKQGDPEAVGEVAALCLRGERRGDGWLKLARFAPERFRQTAAELEPLAPTPALLARAVIRTPRVAAIDELPEAYANLPALTTPSDRATFAWELLRRCRAEHVFPWTERTTAFYEALIHDQGAVYLYEEDEARVQRWLSPPEFGPLLDALQGERWAEAIAWCAWWCTEVGGDDAGAVWTRATFQLLTDEPSPGELHARVATCLAIAAGERAIEREHPFTECDIEEQFARACACPGELEAERRALVEARWRELSLDEGTREDLAGAFDTTLTACGPRARDAALELAAALPDFPLTEKTFELPDDVADEHREKLSACLAAQPEALYLFGPDVLDADGVGAKRELLRALTSQFDRRAAELLRARFARLVAGELADEVFAATRALGDPSLLPEVLLTWSSGEARAVSTAWHLARLGHREAELPRDLPPELDRRADAAPEPETMPDVKGPPIVLDTTRVGPVTIDVVCNRCKSSVRHRSLRVVVHPDLDACSLAGWDGVTFERIIACGHCGAEDDYTLGPDAMLAIAASRLGRALQAPDEQPYTTRVMTGVASLSDGTPIRRASDGLRHWRSRLAAEPDNHEAWLRLGNLFKLNSRVDEAAEAYRQAVKLRPGHIETLALLLQMLIAEGRVLEGSDLFEGILKALSIASPTPERVIFAELIALALRVAAESGQPLSFTAGWPDGDGDRLLRQGAADLRLVTRWHRLGAFIAQPGVTAMGLKEADADDAHSELMKLIEGDQVIDFAPVAPVADAPAPEVISQAEAPKTEAPKTEAPKTEAPKTEVSPPAAPLKIGRNDPCFCGSRKKYKKCHGAPPS